jgi:hypothetical protein
VRKRSSYKPKPQLLDPLAWVLNGLKPVAEAGMVDVQIKTHNAIDALRRGVATRFDIDFIIEAFNVMEALSRLGVAASYKDDIRAAQDALYAVAKRGADAGYRFVLKAAELNAINLGMEIHDAQIEVTSIATMERAMGLVLDDLKKKRMRIILEKTT